MGVMGEHLSKKYREECEDLQPVQYVEDEEKKDCKRVFELIGSIYFYGDFIAETVNEKELEEILRKNGYFFETEDELMKKLHPEIDKEN